jgi:hypothetical protein
MSYEYVVDLHGTWEREGSGAQAWVNLYSQDYWFNIDFPRSPIQIIEMEVTGQDEDLNATSWSGNRVIRERGTFHVRFHTQVADNPKQALTRAKARAERFIVSATCAPPVLTFT